LQDKVAANVVGAISPKLEQAEIERAKRKPTESLDAYDLYLRGMANVYQWTKEGNSEALRLFYRAIELDPDFASAYGVAAWCYVLRKARGWRTNHAEESAEAARLARRAVQLGKDDALALVRGGYALSYVVVALDEGAAFIDRSLVLNPNLATAWNTSGWAKVWLGEPEVAIQHFAYGMRLSPLDPVLQLFLSGTAFGYFLTGRYDEAVLWAEKAVRQEPTYSSAVRALAASNALAGRLEAAQIAMALLRQADPALRISNLKDAAPFRRPEDLAKFAEGLRKAGLPE
jgi:tetratricopeptide (TPR) repeat protein